MPSLKPIRALRMDDDLYLKIKHLADLDGRSFNNYVVRLLAKFISDYEENHGIIEVDTDSLYE